MEKVIFDSIEFYAIPNCEKYYVSKCGQFYSIKSCKILKISLDKNGYNLVRFYLKGKGRGFTVHSLVAKTFIGLRPIGYDINHKDYNRLNNNVENLEYVTREENNAHSLCNLKRVKIYEYSLDGLFIKEHKSIKDASVETGASSAHIWRVLNMKSETVFGKFFSYEKKDSLPPRKIGKRKGVVVCNLKGEEIIYFDKMMDASKFTNTLISMISSCCRGKMKQSGGYTFKYA
jgi:hypothetical protein